MSERAALSDAEASGPSVYTLCVIALMVTIAGLLAAHGAALLLERARAGDDGPALAETHHKTIGAQHYVVPAALLPVESQRADGFTERMDLVLALPLGPGSGLTEIEIAILPRGRVRTSAHLLDAVYLHQFAAEEVRGAPGLVGKPLRSGGGYQGETVWYDPLSANPFVAKCMTPVDPAAPMRTCLRTVLLSDRNAAILGFAPEVLVNWREVDAVVESWLDGLRQ